MLATRRGGVSIAMADFVGAVERIVAGLEKRSRILIPKERRTVAYHEMGHALVALSIPGTDPVQKISIIPRGIGALGYTLQRPGEDRFLMSRQELEDRMAVLMGGRAAEMVLGEDISTGASDDLAKATDIARGMVLRAAWIRRSGRSPGTPSMGISCSSRACSGGRQSPQRQAAPHGIDVAVRAHLDAALDRALEILRGNRAALDEGAAALLAHETLTGDEIPRPTPVETL